MFAISLILFICPILVGSTTDSATRASALTITSPRTDAFCTAHTQCTEEEKREKEIELKKKDTFAIVDINSIKFTKELAKSIPFFYIGEFSDHRAIAIQKILTINGKIRGSLTYYYKPYHCDKAAYILGIGIKEGFRNRGYGSYLMKEILKKMATDGIQEVNLTSRPEAITFNKKCGFNVLNRKGLMQLRLAAQQSTL